MERNKQWFWPFYGKGLDSFGINHAPVLSDIPEPKEGEVLVKVNAFTICASDAKMVRLGNDYPLFKGRDFEQNPAILGHELSLTVVKPGKGMEKAWPVGMRVGIQPDVYLNGERFCIGVTAIGGMQQYLLLGKEVFHSDYGSSVFTVPDHLSEASVALLEPLACVEASFRQWSRRRFDINGVLLVYINEVVEDGYIWDVELNQQKIVVIDDGHNAKRMGFPAQANVVWETSIDKALRRYAKNGFQDVLVVGTPSKQIISSLVKALSDQSIFCWLPDKKPEPLVSVDVAKAHYENINWLGTPTKRLSSAFDDSKKRYTYQPDGSLLIIGGTGAMGRIHTLRALELPDGPKTVVVTGRGEDRLNRLLNDFTMIARKNGKKLIGFITDPEGNWKEKVNAVVGKKGFDDVILCAPGSEPVELASTLLAEDGMMVLFSGTNYGQYADIPLGLVAFSGANITSSSGSRTEDQKNVLEHIRTGETDPNRHIAAIGGLKAAKQGIQAVLEGKYPGKIVIFPFLEDLQLLSIYELDSVSSILAEIVKQKGWSHEAEKLLFEIYNKEGNLCI